MSASLIVSLVLYSFGMASGQILFKLSATAAGSRSGVMSFLNWYLIAGVILYFSLTIFWVWLLRSVPLSRAYPFTALAFIFTPLMANLMFGERLSLHYCFGMLLIASGILVITRQ